MRIEAGIAGRTTMTALTGSPVTAGTGHGAEEQKRNRERETTRKKVITDDRFRNATVREKMLNECGMD